MHADAYFDADRLARRPGGDAYVPLLTATRSFLDAVCASDPPPEVCEHVAALLSAAAAELVPHDAHALAAPAGNRADLPGTGHPLQPPVVLDDWPAQGARGRVTFSRAHDASGGAVHGGLLPLVYDDVLGRLAARHVPRVRTAFLTVDYHAITPVASEILIEAQIDEVAGRKVFVSGRMHHAGTTLTTARALFVILRADHVNAPAS